MGAIQDLVTKHDTNSQDGFQAAMRGMEKVSEGEIRFIVAYPTEGQTVNFRKQHALARAELERRGFAEQKKLTYNAAIISAASGFIGVIVGALSQVVF